MDDLISRSDALKALGEEPEVWVNSDYEIASRNQWNTDRLAIETLPSTQLPEWAQKVEQKYSEALSNPHIKKPLAWALYEVWKEVDKNG